jgi:hypothetical protein
VSDDFDRLLAEIRACRGCAAYLPLGPRPVGRGARLPDRSAGTPQQVGSVRLEPVVSYLALST